MSDGGLSVFVRPPGRPIAPDEKDPSPSIELFVRSYGQGGGQRLADQVIAWDTTGRPSSNGLHVRAYLEDGDHIPSLNEIVVHKESTKLVLYWE